MEPQHLTRELLDWVTNAITAVLVTPEIHAVLRGRPESALVDALKQVDHLWPYAVGETDAEAIQGLEARAMGTASSEVSGDPVGHRA